MPLLFILGGRLNNCRCRYRTPRGGEAAEARSQLAKSPAASDKAVARERLFAKLDGAREHRPGSAWWAPRRRQTTLVASWLDARGIKGIWSQVDPGDADLATFFYYLGKRRAVHPQRAAAAALAYSGISRGCRRVREAVFPGIVFAAS